MSNREYPLWDEDDANDTSLEDFENFLMLPENQDKTFELLDGKIVMMAGNVGFNHARISSYISRKIGNFLEGGECEVVQDVNVYLFKENLGICKNVYQPDIIIGCNKDIMTDKGYEGTPELVIEIISKTTARHDYFTKYIRYMQFGVLEYWIVDLRKNQILVYLNSDGDSPDVFKYTFSDVIEVSLFPGLKIDFREILKLVD